MRLLHNAFQYDAWATDRLLTVTALLDETQLNQKVDGMFGSTLDTWRHQIQVSYVYHRMIFGGLPEREFAAAPLPELVEVAATLGPLYDEATTNLGEGELQRKFNVPWFERDFSVEDGLFQVITHSIEHRADIASALSRFGLETPPIDYVMWWYLSGPEQRFWRRRPGVRGRGESPVGPR
ncbi:hypothetical protein AYO38_06135 [bacterium SCGC AG-212-C10]|nr:hypothetical protein AYO38_06135 [bacterium SCGC AG-212-C10]